VRTGTVDSTPGRRDTPALEANRRGELSEAHRRVFGALSRDRRRSGLSSAAFFAAGALLIAFFASPSSSMALRMLLTASGLAIAAVLVVRLDHRRRRPHASFELTAC
jgi:hypothetical protein